MRTSEAVIYADQQLKSPIGYVTRGQELWVGEKKRKSGTIVPVAINGQVGWVKVIDLQLEEEMKITGRKALEHNVHTEKEGGINYDPLDENNFFQFRIASYSPSFFGDTSSESNNVVNILEEQFSGSSYGIFFEHRFPKTKLNWGVGMSFATASSENFSVQSLNFHGTFSYTPWRWDGVEIDFTFGPLLSIDYQVESVNLGNYRGSMWGGELGGQVRLFPGIGYFVSAGVSYQYERYLALENIENVSDDNINNLSAGQNASFFVALNMSL